jgi:phage terminase large subunit-like protein
MEWIEALCDAAIKWKPLGVAVETGQILGALEPIIKKRAFERKAWGASNLERFPTKFDKAVRAQAIRAYAELKGVRIPTGSAWWPDLQSELLAFPAGKHDDQVDAFGLVGQLLEKMVHGRKPKVKEKVESYAYQDPQEIYGGDKDSFKTL